MEDTKKTKAQLIEELSLLRQQRGERNSVESHREQTQATLLSLSSVVQASIDSIVLTDLEGKILDVNEATLRMYGTNDKGDLVGKNASALIAPADRHRAMAYFQEVLARGYLKGREYHIMLKSGATIPVEMSAALLKDAAGTPLGLVGISRDITERKRMEEELRASEERYRTIIENIEDGYYELDLAGNFTALNDCLCRALGYAKEELLGLNYRQYTDQDNSQTLYQLFNSVYRTGEPARLSEWDIIRKDGERRFFEGSVSLVHNASDQPVGFRGIIRDITERKRGERELQQAKETAEAANRAKSEFLATMSHELRTPLSIVIGYTDLLLEKDFGPATAEQTAALQRVRRAAYQEVELITTLLDLSRLEAGQVQVNLTEVDIQELIAELRQETESSRQKPGLHFEWRVAPEVPLLWTDRFHLKVILTNLIGNAVKFTERGSVMVAVYPHEGGVEWWVTDTGSGIAPEVQAVMFERFRQGHGAAARHYGGVGLGLHIVKRLLELLHGTIVVESEVGKGSTFRVRIPQGSKRTRERAEIDPAPGPQPLGAGGQAGKGH